MNEPYNVLKWKFRHLYVRSLSQAAAKVARFGASTVWANGFAQGEIPKTYDIAPFVYFA